MVETCLPIEEIEGTSTTNNEISSNNKSQQKLSKFKNDISNIRTLSEEDSKTVSINRKG